MNFYFFMKKDILIVNWLLIMFFILMVVSKFISLPFTKVIQPIFFVFIIVHIIQHWKVIIYSFKNLIK
jgi:hypothetical protein